MSAFINSEIFRSSSIDLSAGMGVYEIILTEPNEVDYSSTTRKSSVFGINLGLGWRKSLGEFSAFLDAKYIYLNSSLCPNLLQISVGIFSN